MKPHRPSSVLTALTALAAGTALAVLAGCAGDPSKDVGHYVVSVPKTPIFRYGPAQSFGPDFDLTQGQHVVMLRREYGYSRIMTDDGQSGYVATEDLAPAPPPEKAKPSHGDGGNLVHIPTRGNPRPGVSSANSRVLESGPLFGGGDLPPLPDNDPIESAQPPKGSHKNDLEKPDAKEKPEKADKPDKGNPGKPTFRYPKPKPGFRVNVPNPDANKN